MEEDKVVPTTASDSDPVQAEDVESELSPEELEDVQGGIQGGQYVSAEDRERKRQAVQQTENYAQNNNN